MMYKVNLLPEYLQSRRLSSRKMMQLVCFLVFILSLVLTSLFFYSQSRSLGNQLANERNELNKLQPRLTKIQSLKTMIKDKQDQYLVLSQMRDNRLVWHPFLEDLSLALPADTWLNSIEIKKMEKIPRDGGFVSYGYKPQTENVEEKSKSPEASNSEYTALALPNVIYLSGSCWTMGSVGVLVDNLYLLPYFTSVKLIEANLDRRKGFIKFEIAAKIKGGARDVRKNPQPQP